MRRLLAAFGLCCAALIAQVPAHGQLQQQQRSFWSSPGGNFDYYVLSLSWSPSFCADKGESRGSAQCAVGRGLGFTVHGLWPQFRYGYPSNCPTANRAVPRNVMDGIQDLFPDESLARYEWRKHGSCTGTDPASYFRDTRNAAQKVRIPEKFKNLKQSITMSGVEIQRAFSAANPGLRPEMMRVACRRGQLQEVRVCFDSRVRGFQECTGLERSDCGFFDVRLEPAR